MAGDINVLVHRERVHATDNPITIRPTGLSGITPKAVYAFCSADFDTDGTIGADAGFSEGFTDGTTTCSKGVFEEDAQGTTQVRMWQADGDLCQILNVAGTELLALDSPSLVSGGLNLTPSTRTNRPTVTYVFFYGADLQVAAGKITGFDAGGGDGGGDTVAVTTGISGSNLDNQLILFLTGQSGPTWTSLSASSSSLTSRSIGAAYRDGVAGAPDAQWATTYATRQAAGVGRCENTVRTDRVACAIVGGALNKSYSCTDISDTTFTVQAFGTAQNTPLAYLVLETDTKKTWCGVEDSSTTGTWTVTSPGWEPGFVQANFTQATALSAIKTSDLDVYGCGVATADDQSCQTASNKDASGDTVCKSLASDKFLDVLEDDGTSGWEQAATGDFVFSSTGWTVSNITVGTAGSSSRKFPCFAMEVASAVGPEQAAFSEGILATDAEIPTATALGQFVEAMLSSDALSGSATASAGISESFQAAQIDGGTAAAIGNFVGSADAAELLDAIAAASAAILQGALAGEAWVSSTLAANLGEFTESTQASETFVAAAQTIASITEIANASDIMISMAQAFANIAEGATATDAFTSIVAGLLGELSDGSVFSESTIATAQAFGEFSESGTFSDAFDATELAAPLGEILLAISADALFGAVSQVRAGFAAAVTAGDVFIALEPSVVVGHLIIGSIAVQATLKGIASNSPAMSGIPSVN